jgi:CBS domain containing-hemolysin-like protein
VTAVLTRLMVLACWPVIVVLERVNQPFRRRSAGSHVSRAELAAAVRLGRRTGAIEDREYEILRNVLHLADRTVAEVLTPRTVVFALPATTTVGQVVAEHRPIRFARIPVYRGSPDEITGYVARYDVLAAYAFGRADQPLAELARPIEIVPEPASVADALERLLRARQHIALVVDEYGGTAGIVTLEDSLETLLGEEIVDETDPAVDMRQLAREARAEPERGDETADRSGGAVNPGA